VADSCIPKGAKAHLGYPNGRPGQCAQKTSSDIVRMSGQVLRRCSNGNMTAFHVFVIGYQVHPDAVADVLQKGELELAES
jgi:hypothetical protein